MQRALMHKASQFAAVCSRKSFRRSRQQPEIMSGKTMVWWLPPVMYTP